MAWYNNSFPISQDALMSPCSCILGLRLSSLRLVFDSTCAYLNRTCWTMLYDHFSRCQMLDKEDIEAILQASKLRKPTPTEEMILRLERDKKLTIDAFLKHLKAGLASMQDHYTEIFMQLAPLHSPHCQVYVPPAPIPVVRETANGNDSWQVCQSDRPSNCLDSVQTFLRIVKHPVDTRVEEGDLLVLRCSAESKKAIAYCWQKNGRTLPDFTDKVLMIPCIEPCHRGDYVCVVNSGSSHKSSKPARVTVLRTTENSHSVESSPPHSGFVASDKFALLIANESYTHIATLTSATNDVKALAATLRDKLNFKTMTLINLTLPEMEKAVKVFCRHLVHGAYCITYLAGHGFENDGQCYIVPIDAPHEYMADHCFSLRKMIEDIRTSCYLNLSVFLLDVCRRRNKNTTISFTEENGRGGKAGNYIISYATVEHGMAYEVKGRELGIYVSSLQKYLASDERVMRMLELVNQDINRKWSAQQSEFKSNIFEDRKLTDPVVSEGRHIAFCELWQTVHVEMKPTLFVFESCNVKVELRKTCLFSNKLSIEPKVLDKGDTEECSVSISLQGCRNTSAGIDIENLQRLLAQDVSLTVFLCYKLNSNVFKESWEDSISIPFVSWWNEPS